MGMAKRKSLTELIAEVDGEKPEPRGVVPAPKRLSTEERRRRFAHEYLFGKQPFNATEAYISACPDNRKPKRKSAGEMGSKWLKEPFVQHELGRLVKQASQRREIDQDFVLGHWIAMTQANVFDHFRVQEGGPNDGHLVLKSPEELTLEQQQNVRKLKVRTTNYKREDGTEIAEQTVELEIEHKKHAIDQLAKFLGLGGGDDGEEEDLVRELREAEERALRRAATVTIDNDTGRVVK